MLSIKLNIYKVIPAFWRTNIDSISPVLTTPFLGDKTRLKTANQFDILQDKYGAKIMLSFIHRGSRCIGAGFVVGIRII